MSTYPSYSVVIPAYNATAFIGEAIASIMAQGHVPDEIVVVDDGSTDDLGGVLVQCPGPIRLLRQENQGSAAATNLGMNAVTNRYVATLDSDDLWAPGKIEAQLDVLLEIGPLACVFTRAESFGDEELTAGVDDSKSGWGRSTLMTHMDVWELVGPMNRFPGDRGDNADWIARAREAGVQCHMIEQFLAKRRLRPGSLSFQRDPEADRGYLKMMHQAILRKRQAQGQ